MFTSYATCGHGTTDSPDSITVFLCILPYLIFILQAFQSSQHKCKLGKPENEAIYRVIHSLYGTSPDPSLLPLLIVDTWQMCPVEDAQALEGL